MKKTEWGPCIWTFLHCLSIKIKDEFFMTEKITIIDLIRDTCSNLPCPTCSSHAILLLKKYNIDKINSKENLIKLIFIMHNEVNKKLKKNLYNYNILINTYNKYNFMEVLNKYNYVIKQSNYNEKMMLHSFYKKRYVKKFRDYFLKNISKYNI